MILQQRHIVRYAEKLCSWGCRLDMDGNGHCPLSCWCRNGAFFTLKGRALQLEIWQSFRRQQSSSRLHGFTFMDTKNSQISNYYYFFFDSICLPPSSYSISVIVFWLACHFLILLHKSRVNRSAEKFRTFWELLICSKLFFSSSHQIKWKWNRMKASIYTVNLTVKYQHHSRSIYFTPIKFATTQFPHWIIKLITWQSSYKFQTLEI